VLTTPGRLRPISPRRASHLPQVFDTPPLYLGFFQFVHNARRRGKALLGTLITGLVA